MSLPKLDKLHKGTFEDAILRGGSSLAEHTTRNDQTQASSYIVNTTRTSPRMPRKMMGNQVNAKSMVFNRNKMMMNNYSFSQLSNHKPKESFDVSRKSGKEIIDYFSSFGKEGIELFLKEANTRNYFKKNSLKHGLTTEKGSPTLMYSHRSNSVMAKDSIRYSKRLSSKQEKPQGFVDYAADKNQSLKTRVDHYMKLMEFEDEETILNNDSTQLLKNIQRNKKKILVQQKETKPAESFPEITKRQSRLDVLKQINSVALPKEDLHDFKPKWKMLPTMVSPVTNPVAVPEEPVAVKTPAPQTIEAIEQVEKIMGNRALITKIKREHFDKFVLNSDKFQDLFMHLDNLTQIKTEQDQPIKKKTKKDLKKKIAAPEEEPCDEQNPENNEKGSNKIYGRLSKYIIKQHIMKRYKRKIADRIMHILDEKIGSTNNINSELYMEVLFNILIAPYPVPIKSVYGREFSIPGIFKFCFDVFDLNEKGSICEHDIFQLIQQVQNDSEKNQVDEQKRIDDLPIDYTVNHIPVISNSIFIDAFAYDISLIFSNMVSKASTKKTTNTMDVQTTNTSPSKLPKEDTLPKKPKKKENRSEMSYIFEGLMEHYRNNLLEVQNANNPNAEIEEFQQKYMKKGDIFSHNFPINKQLENKKLQNKYILSIGCDEDNPHYCKQIKFSQFSQMQFHQVIPQFIIDFFYHMTQMDLMEIINQNFKIQKDKQKPGNTQKSDLDKSQNSAKWSNVVEKIDETQQPLKKSFKANKTVALKNMPLQDYLFLRRELEFDNIKSNMYQVIDMNKDYDETKIFKSIIFCFRQLSVNGNKNVHDLDVFLTFESLKEKYPKYAKLKHNNPSFCLRLYNILSRGLLMKRIYLPQFLIMVYPLIFGNWVEKNYFAFKMYDGDNDGIISSIDISDIIKNLVEQCPYNGHGKWQTRQCECSLYHEVMKIYDFTLNKNLLLLGESKKKLKKSIDFSIFLQDLELGISCIVIELQHMLLKEFRRLSEIEFLELEKQEKKKQEHLKQLRKTEAQYEDSEVNSPQSPAFRRSLTKLTALGNLTGQQKKNTHFDQVKKIYDDIKITGSKFSIFDHSSPDVVEAHRRWVEDEQYSQLEYLRNMNMEMSIDFTFEQQESVNEKIYRKRQYILKTGCIPGAENKQNVNASINNLRHYAKTVKQDFDAHFDHWMNIEEELNAGRPNSQTIKRNLLKQINIDIMDI